MAPIQPVYLGSFKFKLGFLEVWYLDFFVVGYRHKMIFGQLNFRTREDVVFIKVCV